MASKRKTRARHSVSLSHAIEKAGPAGAGRSRGLGGGLKTLREAPITLPPSVFFSPAPPPSPPRDRQPWPSSRACEACRYGRGSREGERQGRAPPPPRRARASRLPRTKRTPSPLTPPLLPLPLPAQVFISDIRACQNREAEAARVDKELGKIRKKFATGAAVTGEGERQERERESEG